MPAAGEGDYSIAVNVYLVGDRDPASDLVSAKVTVEQLMIPEFSAVLVPVAAMVTILFVGRRRHLANISGRQ